MGVSGRLPGGNQVGVTVAAAIRVISEIIRKYRRHIDVDADNDAGTGYRTVNISDGNGRALQTKSVRGCPTDGSARRIVKQSVSCRPRIGHGVAVRIICLSQQRGGFARSQRIRQCHDGRDDRRHLRIRPRRTGWASG